MAFNTRIWIYGGKLYSIITLCGLFKIDWICSGADCMFECKYIYNISFVLVHQQNNRGMFSLSLLFLALPFSSFASLHLWWSKCNCSIGGVEEEEGDSSTCNVHCRLLILFVLFGSTALKIFSKSHGMFMFYFKYKFCSQFACSWYCLLFGIQVLVLTVYVIMFIQYWLNRGIKVYFQIAFVHLVLFPFTYIQ